MIKPLKSIFKKSGAGRFIKLDGTGWAARGLRAHFQSVAVRAGAVCIAGMAAYSVWHSTGRPEEYMLMMGNLLFAGIATLHARNNDNSITAPYAFWNRFTRYAIDTEGRAFPPVEELDLLEEVRGVRAEAARILTRIGGPVVVMTAAFGGLDHMIAPDRPPNPYVFITAAAMTPILIRAAALLRRCNKLLHPDHIYRFAANPPLLPAPERAKAPAGARTARLEI